MSHKRKKKEPRPQKAHRRYVILDIVRTDSTFEQVESRGEKLWVGKCIHCNSKIVVTIDGQTGATIEHLTPLAADGTNDIRNLALACSSCNNRKGIDHDIHVGKGGRADQVVAALQAKRLERWRETWKLT